MIKVFLVHGFGGEPNGGWRPYLMRELQKLGVYACALAMPSPDAPVCDEWVGEVTRYVEQNPDDDLYLVGHSLGGATIFKYLEQHTPTNVRGAIMVSAPCRSTGNEKTRAFVEGERDWETIRRGAGKFVVIHGDDDEVVPFSHAEEIAHNLGAPLITVPGGKHLNGSAGFTELPEALQALRELMGI